MLTNGPSEAGTFTGAAYEGIGFLPWLAEKVEFILAPLFGFTSAEGISVPITALGAAGAAIGLIPNLVESGLATGNDSAVFTAMCMCWSEMCIRDRGYTCRQAVWQRNLPGRFRRC